MTCDERLEALLNRAGQTITDLPESDGKHLTYDRETRSGARKAAYDFAHQTGYIDVIDCLAMYEDYILHLTDIIDRLEWALENVIGERDYLIETYLDCSCCLNGKELDCNCEHGDHFEWGVPEDWSADDD